MHATPWRTPRGDTVRGAPRLVSHARRQVNCCCILLHQQLPVHHLPPAATATAARTHIIDGNAEGRVLLPPRSRSGCSAACSIADRRRVPQTGAAPQCAFAGTHGARQQRRTHWPSVAQPAATAAPAPRASRAAIHRRARGGLGAAGHGRAGAEALQVGKGESHLARPNRAEGRLSIQEEKRDTSLFPPFTSNLTNSVMEMVPPSAE